VAEGDRIRERAVREPKQAGEREIDADWRRREINALFET
jgi:hypothetical protein